MVQASRRKYHYIYKITRDDGKYYIGMHSTDDLVNDKYFGSGKRLWYSINKHGIEKHSKEIIEHCFSREILREREKEIVNEELLSDPMCMNLKIGGDGGWDYAAIGAKGNATQKQLFAEDKDWKQKRGNAIRNKIMSNKTWMENNRKMLKNRHKNGEVKYDTFGMLGKKHSDVSKQKMKDAHSGNNNSQYETCWIYSNQEKISKKVKKLEIDFWLSSGWILGRKIKFNSVVL